MSKKSEGAALARKPRPQEDNEAEKKNTADGDVGQGDDGLEAAEKTTHHLTSSRGYVAIPSRYIDDDYWWKDNAIRLRHWLYAQHRRDYRHGRGCVDGIRSIARALGYSTGRSGQIMQELERDGHLDGESFRIKFEPKSGDQYVAYVVDARGQKASREIVVPVR